MSTALRVLLALAARPVIGGQAVIEGVMMRSPTRVAVAVRRPDGSIAYLERAFESITRRVKPLGLPVVRGEKDSFQGLGGESGALQLPVSSDSLALRLGKGSAAFVVTRPNYAVNRSERCVASS